MSYTYLQEQGEESSVDSFSDIPLSVLSRLNLTAEKSCFNDSEMGACPSSQSGMTYGRLAGHPGGEPLTLCAEDSLVKTSLQQGQEGRESQALNPPSGLKCSLRTKGLGLVLQGLSDAGYDATWCVPSAADCGANHERKRMWILGRKTSNPDSPQCEGRGLSGRGDKEHSNTGVGSWWKDTPLLHRVDDGVANRMDRLKAIGNGQVSIVAATAYRFLKEQLT